MSDKVHFTDEQVREHLDWLTNQLATDDLGADELVLPLSDEAEAGVSRDMPKTATSSAKV